MWSASSSTRISRPVEPYGAVPEVVEQAAGRRDEHVDAGRDGARLRAPSARRRT